MNQIGFVREDDVKDIEESLTERFERLIEVLTKGTRHTSEFPVITNIEINKTHLRLAIDDFSTILKEIKRLSR